MVWVCQTGERRDVLGPDYADQQMGLRGDRARPADSGLGHYWLSPNVADREGCQSSAPLPATARTAARGRLTGPVGDAKDLHRGCGGVAVPPGNSIDTQCPEVQKHWVRARPRDLVIPLPLGGFSGYGRSDHAGGVPHYFQSTAAPEGSGSVRNPISSLWWCSKNLRGLKPSQK